MIKLNQASSHTISIIPRQGTIDKLLIKDESTKTEIEVIPSLIVDLGNYTEVEFEYAAIEGVFATFKALSASGDILYYDKIFCTSQSDYSIVKDNYTEQIEDTNYKIFTE